MLIRVSAAPGKRGELLEIGSIFKATAIDGSPSSLCFQVTGEPRKINDVIELVRPYGIAELVLSGRLAMGREPKARRAILERAQEVRRLAASGEL